MDLIDRLIQIAKLNRLDPELLMALVQRESEGSNKARSKKGAIGFTQLMPGTARELNVNPRDPVQNLVGGATYLRKLNEQSGSLADALLGYNAGPRRVEEGRIPKESWGYLADILTDWQNMKGQRVEW